MRMFVVEGRKEEEDVEEAGGINSEMWTGRKGKQICMWKRRLEKRKKGKKWMEGS